MINRLAKTLLTVVLAILVPRLTVASGNWLKLANTAPGSVSFMLLLSDGTVMAANNPDDITGDFGNSWFRLVPDPNGHYVNGEWYSMASMTYARHAFASQVLTNGMVFIAGGEHPEDGAGGASAEIYNPLTDSWILVNPPASMMNGTQICLEAGGFNPPQNQGFLDSESTTLPNGDVLLAPVLPSVNNGTLVYDPGSNVWSQGQPSINWQAEVSWVKLPDGSILTIDPLNGYPRTSGTNSERYIPSLNQWIPDANVPVNLWANMGPKLVGEIGPAFLLPNGKALFLGGNGFTAIYTPSGGVNAGSWVAGPNIPGGLASADAPAAMMPNGKILCAVAGIPSGDSSGNPTFPTPTSFFEYDYSVGPTGQFTQVSGPTGTTDDIRPQDASMLVLPDGSVLYCHIEEGNLFYSSFGSQLYVYAPDTGQGNATEPFITSITPNADGSFHLIGTGLTGISEGAAFGDDAQMACNYPLVTFEDTNNGHIDYARTYNWNSTGVRTGGAVQTTEFTLPPGLIPQSYLVSVSAVGVTSAPVTFSFVTPSSLSMCPGDSGTVSVIPSPQPATYQWLFNGNPLSGQTNSQLNFISATTNQSGFYSLKVISSGGAFVSQQVQVSVGVWVIQPPSPTNTATLCQPYSLSFIAQGKGPLSAQWFRNGNPIILDSRISTNSVPQTSGGTTLSLNFSDIKYQDDGTYTVVVTDDCGHVTTAPFSLRVSPNPPWAVVATQGPPSREYAAMAYDSDRHVTVLFGGQISVPSGPPVIGDTWEFDGTNWMQRFPITSPAPRSQAQMVYDSLRHRTVLFGGQVYTNLAFQFLEETWEWNGTNWQKIVTANVPNWTALDPYGACYDSEQGEMLAFGGITNGVRANQLWAYNGINWTQKTSTGTNPVAQENTAMAFDSLRGVAVLLGANSQLPSTPYKSAGGVWEWDGSQWQERPQSGQIYGGYQSYDMMAYDAFRGECVLYGSVFGIVDGIASSSSVYTNLDGYRFIWRWNGQQWQADPPTPTQGAPYGQISGNLVFDSQRSGILLFGGIGGYGGLVTNYTYEILYQDDPAVLKQPTVQVSLQGQQVQLSVVAVGAPPIGYQWQKGTTDLKDGGHISGSTSNTLTINDAVPTDSGNYQLTLSNLCGLAVSQPILLNITTGPGTIAIGTEGGNSVNGSNIVITWGDNSAVLQSSTNVQGPWFNLPGATSPYMVQSNLPTQFFRLSYP